MGQDVEKLQELIDQHDRIVFFGGAGVSTESGIPDFRSKDGLYNQQYTYPPEEIFNLQDESEKRKRLANYVRASYTNVDHYGGQCRICLLYTSPSPRD